VSTIADLPSSAKRQFRETRIGADENGLTASAVWRVAYGDIPAFFKAAGGLPQTVGGVLRVIPLQFPDFGSNVNCFAYRVDAKAIGHNQQPAPNGNYTDALVTVYFKTYLYAFDGNQAFLTVDLEESGRYMNGPASSFQFGGGGLPTQDVGLFAAGFTQRITLYRLAGVNFPLYASLANTVNQAPFNNFPIGTVLYKGPGANATTTVAGQTSYQVTHVFEYSSVPWNYEVQPGSGGPALMTFKGGTYRYPLADFGQFFT
jgi:hypothetical protein